jgi:hypothetical protein
VREVFATIDSQKPKNCCGVRIWIYIPFLLISLAALNHLGTTLLWDKTADAREEIQKQIVQIERESKC